MVASLKRLFRLVVFSVVAIVGGFGIYWSALPAQTQYLPRNIATIVVLTGGAGRIDFALQQLEKQPDLQVVISGVNPQTSLADITLGHALTETQLTNLVLDHKAQTTRQNVAFVAQWAKKHGVRQVGLVTSHYHMPRVRLLFALYAPGLTIVPLAVKTPTSLSFFVREYAKLLFAPLLK